MYITAVLSCSYDRSPLYWCYKCFVSLRDKNHWQSKQIDIFFVMTRYTDHFAPKSHSVAPLPPRRFNLLRGIFNQLRQVGEYANKCQEFYIEIIRVRVYPPDISRRQQPTGEIT